MILQFPGNDMSPEPELSDDDWWADESIDPPPDADFVLPAKTATEQLMEDADHWDRIPGVVRGFLAAMQRADRIAELAEADSYIHRQSIQIVRRKIPVIREWLNQLEELLGTDPEAAASLSDDVLDNDNPPPPDPFTPEGAREILSNHDAGFDRLRLPGR